MLKQRYLLNMLKKGTFSILSIRSFDPIKKFSPLNYTFGRHSAHPDFVAIDTFIHVGTLYSIEVYAVVFVGVVIMDREEDLDLDDEKGNFYYLSNRSNETEFTPNHLTTNY